MVQVAKIFVFIVMSVALSEAASLNDMMKKVLLATQEKTSQSPKPDSLQDIVTDENPHQLIEEKIQSEFHKVYGEDKEIIFVSWRLPRFRDPKTGHWNLNKNNTSQAPKSFRVETIEVSQDQTKVKAIVFYQSGDREKSFVIRGRIDNLIEIPVLNRSVHYGDLITKEDITWKKVSDRKSGRYLVSNPEDLVGRHPKGKYIRAGVPINQQDVIMPLYVEKGSYVTVSYENGKVNLQMKGKALDQGYQGNTIRILNEASHKIVHATVEGPSRVRMVN